MARLMLVANPAASQFTGGDHRAIVSLLRRRHLVEAVWPQSAADARTIAADAITAGFDGVVAMGGDGIVHHVAQSLVGTDVFLGVIPVGTTNVYSRQLGLSPRPLRAARYLASDIHVEGRPVLAVRAHAHAGPSTTSYAVFAAGLGFDADVVAMAETEPFRKYRFGSLHYARTSLGLLWSDIRHRRPTMAVTGGGRAQRAMAVIAQFHPAFTYFGRRPLTFDSVDPSPVNLLVIERLPVRRLPALVGRLALGRPLSGIAGVEVWRDIHEWQIDAQVPARCQLDGELIGELDAATFTFLPSALRVAVPGRR